MADKTMTRGVSKAGNVGFVYDNSESFWLRGIPAGVNHPWGEDSDGVSKFKYPQIV